MRPFPLCFAWTLATDTACGAPDGTSLAAHAPLLSSEGTVLDTCAPSRRDRIACAIDGDTLDLGACGTGERVRLLGINAPEVSHPGQTAECGSDAATLALQGFAGLTVTLSFDQVCVDTYDRTLAWLWVEPDEVDTRLGPEARTAAQAVFDDPDDAPVLLAAAFAVTGLARRYDPEWALPTRFDGPLTQAERQAQADQAGVWGSCDSPDDSSR